MPKKTRAAGAGPDEKLQSRRYRTMPDHPSEGTGLGWLSPELRRAAEAAERGPRRAIRAWLLVSKTIESELRAWAAQPLSEETGERSQARWLAVTGMLRIFREFLLECAVIHPDSLHLESRVHAACRGWDAIDPGLPEVVMAHLDLMDSAKFGGGLRFDGTPVDPQVVEERMFGEGALPSQLRDITRAQWAAMSERWITAPPLSAGLPGPPREYGQAKIVFPVLRAKKLMEGMSYKEPTPERLARPGGRKAAEAELALAARKMLNAARAARKKARERARAAWG